jgi:hypothetical protein
MLTEVFSRDMLKSFAGTYREYKKAQDNTKKLNCEEAAMALGKKSKKYSKKFFEKLGKEG